jgi:ribonuclease HI
MIEVYIDGSSKGNPGPGGAGIVIQDTTAKEIIGIHGIPLGYVTNNQAEFLALKHALMELKNQRRSSNPVNILTDSQLVVGIFSQNWKAKANLAYDIQRIWLAAFSRYLTVLYYKEPFLSNKKQLYQ